MGLSATMNTAQSALATNAALTSIVARNIAGVNDGNYTRKSGEVTGESPTGSSTRVSIQQATNAALFATMLNANSGAATAKALSDGLDSLENTVSLTSTATSSSSTTTDTSPSTLIGTLASALQTYGNDPSSTAAGQAVVTAANTLARNLNTATAAVQTIRSQADASMASGVKTINTLLAQFQTINTAVVSGIATGADVTDTIDQRNTLLQSLSQQIGVSTSTGPNGSMSIYTDSGVTLFQGTARTVSFSSTPVYAAGTVGNAISVDGVTVTGASATMPVKTGALAGLAQLRDTTTVQYQNQLDQTAQGLIDSFAESDQTGGGAATIPGLFTATDATVAPTTVTAGLAANIKVNANVDPAQGGTLTLLRDGGIGDPTNAAYKANTTGAAGYATHLTALLTSLDATRTFDASSGGSASATLAGYANSSLSWLEANRQQATSTTSDTSALVSATTTSLSSATGVNLDEQLSKMLDLEHSYSASAELMSAVKSMFDSLLQAA